MNILGKIISHKKEEVEVRKMMLPEAALKDSIFYERSCFSLRQKLSGAGCSGIIAEFKRRSPSKGFIKQEADAARITECYTRAGAGGISVLTDHEFFGGSNEDLIAARKNDIPILRKDFIIDAYQLTEAKAIGADVILLIAACLTVSQTTELAAIAKQLGMEVLLELHEEKELDHICRDVDMVGINNRDLKTFKTDINRSIELSKMIPSAKLKIAESGINHAADLNLFRKAGYSGFLIGERFMREAEPGKALENFIRSHQIMNNE